LPPAWLPPIECCDGEWDVVVARLYGVFQRDFKYSVPAHQGLPVWHDRRILPGGLYEEGFWHLISQDDRNTGVRLPEFRRAERLCWCRPTISNWSDGEVTVFDYLEGSGKVRTYVWLRSESYLAVLEKQQKKIGDIFMLITAFYLDGRASEKRIEQKYANRASQEMQSPP